jgi:hypothetical protein
MTPTKNESLPESLDAVCIRDVIKRLDAEANRRSFGHQHDPTLRAVHSGEMQALLNEAANHLHVMLEAALTREAPTEAVGAEWLLVPKIPTQAMIAAGEEIFASDGKQTRPESVYDVMVHIATPPAPQRLAQGEESMRDWSLRMAGKEIGQDVSTGTMGATQPPHHDRGGGVAGELQAILAEAERMGYMCDTSVPLDTIRAAIAALTEAKQQGPGEEGFVLMPSEATDAMLQAFKGVSLNYQDILYQDRLLGGNVPGITDRDQVVRAMETYNFAKRYRAMVAACALATAPKVEAKRHAGEMFAGIRFHDEKGAAGTAERLRRWARERGNRPTLMGQTMDEAATIIERLIAAAAKPSGEE